MTKKELELVKELVDQVTAINNKLDSIIAKLDSKPAKKQTSTESDELNTRGIVNELIHICTHPNYDNKQYCGALKQLRDLDFALSPKQTAWILAYTFRHPEAGESIIAFLEAEFKKTNDKDKYVSTIAFELRKNYATERNGEFIEGIVKRIKEMWGDRMSCHHQYTFWLKKIVELTNLIKQIEEERDNALV